jgi:hypothetical protein
LGGAVPFSYCRFAEADRLPCFKIVDCWWETFDVVRYLKDHLAEDDFRRLMHARPRPKIASLVELADRARERRNS